LSAVQDQLKPLRALLVDDEKPARTKLRTLLRNLPEISVVAEAGNASAALSQLAETEIDVVFLDIEMPGMRGLELATLLQPGISVIFATAYDEHAVRAFDLNAVDYLLKPFTLERLGQAVARVLRERSLPAATTTPLQNALRTLQPVSNHWLLQQRGRLRRIPFSAIEWVDAADNYIEIHTATQTFLDRITLREFLERVPSDQFVRIHRCSAINVSNLTSLAALTRGDAEVQLLSGKTLRVSRSFRRQLVARIS
jgi:two-component system LytT family response regulator